MDVAGLLKAFVEAWLYFGHLQFMVSMVAGIIGGIIIGIIPGIGGAVLNAVFLAFVFLFTPEQALPFMVAVHAVSFTGGCITTILLAVPGEVPG